MSEENKKKNKKIAKMSVSEIDNALKKARENNNNDSSKYIQHLLQRKAELTATNS
ncbi:MAG: hypothetical protein H7A25_02910 [Leptospiraceae bacterium]|nr:hypothetical protein [Leptospiraceae bacterium]MCP5498829.1 hypothetical protein [Leptospiraceae bacterium]